MEAVPGTHVNLIGEAFVDILAEVIEEVIAGVPEPVQATEWTHGEEPKETEDACLPLFPLCFLCVMTPVEVGIRCPKRTARPAPRALSEEAPPRYVATERAVDEGLGAM